MFQQEWGLLFENKWELDYSLRFLKVGNGIGTKSREWKGIGTRKSFPHISNRSVTDGWTDGRMDKIPISIYRASVLLCLGLRAKISARRQQHNGRRAAQQALTVYLLGQLNHVVFYWTIADYDDNLSRNMLYNEHHVLKQLLPDVTNHHVSPQTASSQSLFNRQDRW